MNDFDKIAKEIQSINNTYIATPLRIIADHNEENRTRDDYKDRQIYELMQNADDCYDDNNKYIRIKFELKDNLLIIQNTGKPFDARGIISLMYPNASSKYKDTIGCKGLGFRSVLNWSNEIKIYTKEFVVSFSKENAEKNLIYYKEQCSDVELLDELNRIQRTSILSSAEVSNDKQEINKWLENGYSTSIVLECFDSEIEKIEKQLKELQFEELLFLNHINEVIIISSNLDRKIESIKENDTCIIQEGDNCSEWLIKKKEGNLFVDGEKFKKYQLVLAYNLDEKSRNEILKHGVLYSYFKTEIKMHFPFLVHGTFNLSSERNNLIKQDNENRTLLRLLVEFISEFAVEISETSGVYNYEALKCLIPSETLGILDDEYAFSEMLKDKIKSSRLFPTINNTYISMDDDPKYSEKRFDEVVNKTRFANLLKHCDNDYISDYMTKELHISFYQASEMVNLLNSDADDYINKKVNLELIKLFEEKYGHYVSYTPDLLVDNNDNKITNGVRVFTNPEIKTIEPPNWSNMIFLNKNLETELKRVWRCSSPRELVNYLQNYGCEEYSFDRVLRELINQSKEDKEKTISLLHWLFDYWKNNGNKFDSSLNKINVRILSRDSEIIECSKSYFGNDYDNEVGERIVSCTNYGIFIANKELLQFDNIDDLCLLKKFLGNLGIKSFPEIIKKELGYNERTDYLRINEKHYKVLKTNYGDYSHSELFSGYNKKVIVDYIEDLDDILDKANFEDVIFWIIKNDDLFKIISSDSEVNEESCMQGVPYNMRNYRMVNNNYMYPWIKTVFQNTSWLPTESGGKVDISCITLGKNDLFPVVEVLKVDYNKLNDMFGMKNKKELENLFDKLGIAENLVNLPKEKIYEILLKLPEMTNSYGLAKKFYTQLNLQFDTNEAENLKIDNKNYQEFINSGKVLAERKKNEYEFLPIKNVFYVGKNMYSDDILEEYPKLVLDKRAGDKKVEKIFGVQPIQTIFKVQLKEYNLHQLNDEYSEEYKKILPYLYSKRMDVDHKNKELNILKNSRIRLVSSISLKYIINDVEKEGTLKDYELIYVEKEKTAYIKVPTKIRDIVLLKQEMKFQSAMSEVLSTMLNVDGVKDSFMNIFAKKNFNEIEEYFRLDGDDNLLILNEAKTKFENCIDYENDFWGIIVSISSNKKTDLGEMLPNKFNYSNISDGNNIPYLLELFKYIKKDVDDYNKLAYNGGINLIPFFENKLESLKQKYKKQYFHYKLNFLLNNNAMKKEFNQIKENYNFYTFENISNSVYYDYKQAFEDFVGLSIEQLEKESEDYEDLESKLKEGAVPTFNDRSIDEWESKEKIDKVKLNEEIAKNTTNDVIVSKIVAVQNSGNTHHQKAMQKQNHRQIDIVKKDNGFIAESTVYNTLVKILDKGSSILWVSENGHDAGKNDYGDDSLGYDIKYTDASGGIHYVEVKGSTSQNIEFTLTKKELEVAQQNKENYEIWFVHIEDGHYSQPYVFEKLFIFDEGEDFFNNSKFTVENGDFKIKAKVVKNNDEK